MNTIKKKDVVLIATHNKGKAKEFKELFSKYKIQTKFSNQLGIKEPEETGKTFTENSIIKAKSASNRGFVVVSDDSGLCVDCLGGKPGIFSARVAKELGGWNNAMKKIYNDVKKKQNTTFSAKYVCSLSILFMNRKIYSYLGEIKGTITWPPKGKNGFGYDPFFKPNNSEKTFGETSKEIKMSIDHRSIAFEKLIKSHYTET